MASARMQTGSPFARGLLSLFADPASRANDDGYVLVDAIVALLVMSFTLLLTFSGMIVANQTTVRAQEIQSAEILIRTLMLDESSSFAPITGGTDQFRWSLETTTTPVATPVAVCHRNVQLQSTASVRTYSAASLTPCPVPNS